MPLCRYKMPSIQEDKKGTTKSAESIADKKGEKEMAVEAKAMDGQKVTKTEETNTKVVATDDEVKESVSIPLGTKNEHCMEENVPLNPVEQVTEQETPSYASTFSLGKYVCTYIHAYI